MRLTESQLRRIVRQMLLEEYPPAGSGAPATNGREGQLIDYEDDHVDQKIPMGKCPVPEVGADVIFHGLGMDPCDTPNAMPGGQGPYLGGPDISERKIYPHEIEDAISYLEKFQPGRGFFYSRGGAVALEVLKNGGTLPSEQHWCAPAWGRNFGPMPSDATLCSGKVYLGGRDSSVSLVNMIDAVLANPSLELYVHPWISHKSMIYARVKGFAGKYEHEKLDPVCFADKESLPDWAADGGATDDQVRQQVQWIIKHTKKDWPVKKGFEKESEQGKAAREQVTAEGIIRQVIRNILIEKKKVKCPLKNGKRDYKCEYRKYGGASKKGKKDRAARNQARKVAEREGRVKKGDGKEIDHKKPLSKGGSNAKSNQRVVSRSTNRKKGNK